MPERVVVEIVHLMQFSLALVGMWVMDKLA